MAKKYSKQELDKMLLLVLEEGVKVGDARKALGISHTPAELHGFEFEWYCAELAGELGPRGEKEWRLTPELAAYLRFLAPDHRGKMGWAIGRIMIATNSAEGKVRSAIRDGSKIDDRGHRTGKGGRFLGDDPKLYEGQLKADGTHIPVGERANAREHAEQQLNMKRYMGFEMQELRQMAQDAGLTIRKNWTKVQLVRELAKV